MALSKQQLDLIESTWSDVSKDLQKYGNVMFFKLFEINPHLHGLFPFGDVPIEKLQENESFNKHALAVMETIDAAIDLLKKGKVEDLEDVLSELGMAHVVKSVKKEHFQPVGMALIHALSVAAGNKFTQEAKEAWILVYGFVQKKMGDAMDEFDDM